MSGLDNMKLRLQHAGGDADGRNVKGKLNSFHAALKNSYQAEWITLSKGTETEKRFRCLINPSRLTENFDKKVISIDYDSGIKEGDIFYWDRTNQYWIVNLQQHTEEAYFRGDIHRCEYVIDIDGVEYWGSLKGPEEATLDMNQKHNLVFNNLNYTMSIQITKDSRTMKYFDRFKVIKMKNIYPDVETGEMISEEHRWQVVATDKWSHSNVIDIYLNEYADNAMEDAAVQPEIPEQDLEMPYIDGPRLVNVYDTFVEYQIKNAINGKFVVNSNKVEVIESNENSCVINIITGKSNKFDIIYQRDGEDDIVLNVTIQSF
jgi:hypothetical protein